jgi:purine-binding chemotaxis protein CheW
MTRKRLRYSDLPGSPPAQPAAPVESAAEQQVDAPIVPEAQASLEGELEIIADEPLELEARRPEIALDLSPVAPPPPARPRRNSTPIELARTLAAEGRAAQAKDGITSEPGGDRDAFIPQARTDEPQRTLRERARARSGTAELLMFLVGGERFAVELILVDEVVDLPVIHHVPEMPPAMVGVVTVRGSITPVYSPQHALGLLLAHRDALLIFRRGAHRVGILIDDVDDAHIFDLGDLHERPSVEEGDNVLLGVIRVGTTLVGIVDADALITSCQSANILEPA